VATQGIQQYELPTPSRRNLPVSEGICAGRILGRAGRYEGLLGRSARRIAPGRNCGALARLTEAGASAPAALRNPRKARQRTANSAERNFASGGKSNGEIHSLTSLLPRSQAHTLMSCGFPRTQRGAIRPKKPQAPSQGCNVEQGCKNIVRLDSRPHRVLNRPALGVKKRRGIFTGRLKNDCP
jgi:hypothetical protein